MWRRVLLIFAVLGTVSTPASAGVFRKTPKPDPAQRVPVLLKILKEDPDERKRADAAEELRDYDARAFPDIMPALIDGLQNDPSSSVRSQAASSIGRLRPISQQAGYALEQALQNDSSRWVRVAARTTLWEYHLLGYRSGKPPEKLSEQTEEPPLADPPVISDPVPAKGTPQAPARPVPAPEKPWFSRPLFPLFQRRDQPRPASGEPSSSKTTLPPAPVTSGTTERLPKSSAPKPANAGDTSGPALGPLPAPPPADKPKE